MTDKPQDNASPQDGTELDVSATRLAQTTDQAADQTVLRMPTDHSVSVTDTSLPQASNLPEADAFKVLKSRFVLEERVGSGGMGSVFKAKDLRKVEARDSRPYLAIKVLNNDFKKHPEAFVALEREASKSQGLRHKNIVSIFDFDKDGDTPFITMELLEGQELADLLKGYPSGLPEQLAWPIIKGMVKGLAHAHHEGVVHADFKPGNIYVTRENQARILDFGIARAMRLNGAEQQDVDDGTDFDPAKLAALTPAYASREMLQGDNPEYRDDIYSLGVVIYMVLTGTHPYGRVPADQAAQEGLQPDRIKSLTRAQWRTLSRCLSFNRKDRPETLDQVFDGLFVRTSWKNISVATAAAVVLLAGGLFASAYMQRADINSVKAEVRTETLMYAQVQRIGELLESPQFNPEWSQTLFSELQTLGTVAPKSQAFEAMQMRIQQAFAQEVARHVSLDDAFAVYRLGAQYEFSALARTGLEQRLLDQLEQWATEPLGADWLKSVETAISYQQHYFADSSILAAARLDVLDHLALEIERISVSNDEVLVKVAEQAWNTFAPEMFDAQTYETTAGVLNSAVTAVDTQAAHRQMHKLKSELSQQLEQVLSVSCPRLDLNLVQSQLQRINTQLPNMAASAQDQAITKAGQCVQELSARDPDRGLSFQREAIARLGDSPALQRSTDPCGLSHLVGNGRTPGHAGSCADDVAKESGVSRKAKHKGPQLVVIDAGASTYAISKYEIRWLDLSVFCAQSNWCENLVWPGQDAPREDVQLPATGLPVAVVEAYATWLSWQTGYTYRLPTRDEWLAAAAGDAAPNANCGGTDKQSSLGKRAMAAEAGAVNAAGLVHVFGNVQELVRMDAGYVAVGGAFTDPIEQCGKNQMRQANVEGDQLTGFRLVREVS